MVKEIKECVKSMGIVELVQRNNQLRDRLQKILKTVKKGDTIVFDSVSRMARNADDGTTRYFELYERGINLIFIKERHIDTE